MMTAVEIFTANAIGAGRRCDDEFCPASNHWPIHHIGKRTAFRSLCTACVLHHHRGFFCSACLEVLESPPLPTCDSSAAGVSRCIRCPSVVHSSCVPQGAASNYLCPICKDPEGFSYFPIGGYVDHPPRAMDAAEARALLSASQIAAASMSKEAAAARIEADRKVKLAVIARKIAREILEKLLLVPKKRKEGREEGEGKDRVEENSSWKINGFVKVKKKKKKRKITLSSQSGLL